MDGLVTAQEGAYAGRVCPRCVGSAGDCIACGSSAHDRDRVYRTLRLLGFTHETASGR